MDLAKFIFDVGSAIAFLIVAIIGCALPQRMYANSGRSLAFQLGTMFSAGVMISAGICHLLADAVETLVDEVDFPLAEFLCACGFFLTLILDQIAEAQTLNTAKEESTSGTPLIAGNQAAVDNSGHRHDEGQEEVIKPARISFYTGVLLTIALSVHSILEGLALGTEEDVSSSIGIFIAIVAHKGMAAYALGVCVVESNVSLLTYWMVVGAFCCASPIGVMIGYAISEFSDNVTAACFSALASGTFLYVSFMEILPNELKEPGNKPAKLSLLILGFGLMSIIAIWA